MILYISGFKLSMSDDVPEPSNNPFIRFKRHVDSRIGTGLSILTGTSSSTDSASEVANKPLENMDKAPKPPASFPRADPSVGGRDDSLVPSSTTRFWLAWTLQSPYSPYNLRHLPKPVPAGVSPKDAGLFDFGDAFEDLLAVSSGQNLMDLRERANRKRSLLDLFQLGESPTHWVKSLLSKNLLPEPLHKQHHFGMIFPMAVDEAWGARSGQNSDIMKSVEARKQQLKTLENESTAVGQTLSDSQEQKRHSESLGESWIDKLDRDITFNVASMLREIEEMGKVIEEWAENADSQWQSLTEKRTKRPDQTTNVKPMKTPSQAEKEIQENILNTFDFEAFMHDEEEWVPERNTQNKHRTEPDTEEDFFSAIADAFAETDKVLPSKTYAKDSHEREEVWRWENSAQTVQRDQVGGKSCTWSAEHFDKSGRLHQKTVVRIFDVNGNQVGYETTYRVSHAGQVVKEMRERTGDDENDSHAFPSPNGTTRDKDGWTGWFWR